MNIVYLTSGITGIGRLIRGIAIGNALIRQKIDCNFKIISCSNFSGFITNFEHIQYKVEKIHNYSKELYKTTRLYEILSELNIDILLVDLIWLPVFHFMKDLKCKKVFLARQVYDSYFNLKTKEGIMRFNIKDYDLLIALEPFESQIKMQSVNPVIIKNKNEILSKKKAINALNLDKNKKNCVYAFNGEPGEFEKYKKMYSYLSDTGYNMVYTTNYEQGIFPLADYINAFELLICGGGYNAFWEAVYFNKEAIFIPQKRMYESQEWRIENCQEYKFTENGADQLVQKIMML